MADQRKPEIINIGGYRWEVDAETQALYFMDDESFAEAVAYLREVNQLETMAIAKMPEIMADLRSQEEATKIILPPPGSAPQA
jgi:hypothetical protein